MLSLLLRKFKKAKSTGVSVAYLKMKADLARVLDQSLSNKELTIESSSCSILYLKHVQTFLL